MLSRINQLGKSQFVRNVAIVATGTAGAQVITMAFAPVIARIYGPEAFGLLGAFMAILGVLTPIAALTYPIAIVLPRSDKDAKNLASLSATLALIVSLITAIILLVAGGWLSDILNLGPVAGFILFAPIAMLFSAFQQIFTQWLIRKKQFRITASVAVLQALVMNSAKAGLGWFHSTGAALILIAVAGQALHAFLLWLGIRRSKTFQTGSELHAATFCELAKNYSDFPRHRAPQVTLNALSQGLPVVLLASLFGPAVAGFYSIANMVLGVPTVLIGKSVASVFYPRFNEAVLVGENSYLLLLKAIASLAVIGIAPFGIVVVWGPILFGFVFGDEWRNAGSYAQWLAFWAYFVFITRPVIAAIPVLKAQGLFLAYEGVGFLFRLATLYVGYVVYESALMSIALFSVMNVMLYVVLTLATCCASNGLLRIK